MIVSLAGEWDVSRREELHERLQPAFYHPAIVLDLSAAKYVTTTLITALVKVHAQRLRRKLPAARLAVGSAFVRGLLVETGVADRFCIYDTLERAVADGKRRYRPPRPLGDPRPVAGS